MLVANVDQVIILLAPKPPFSEAFLNLSLVACEAARPGLARAGGCVVNVSSMFAFFGSRDRPAYSASKGGVVGLTRVLAKQLGPWNINVNCLTPGSTMSADITRRGRVVATWTVPIDYPRARVRAEVLGLVTMLAVFGVALLGHALTPDGRMLAFLTSAHLKTMAIDGGVATTMRPAPHRRVQTTGDVTGRCHGCQG